MARMGKKRIHGLVERSTGRPKRKWGDHIKTHLKKNDKARTGFIWLRIGTIDRIS
jgi:hypothetical protein